MEEVVTGLLPQKHTIWDDYVPIIQEGRHMDVYLHDQIESPSEYNKLCHILRHAYTGDTITLHINNGGGYLDGAFSIIAALKDTKAVVTAYLTGTVASASTIIALKCDKIIAADYLQFMIHNYSSNGGGNSTGHALSAMLAYTATPDS